MLYTLEPLEKRQLLTLAVSGGILQLTGSDSANAWELVLSGTTIQLRNSSTLAVIDSISATGVTGANVSMLGGNDLFRIGRPDGTMMPNITATIHGGLGDDSLTGGNGNDQLFGDDGNDRLDGRAGGDLMDGGTGFDTADYSYRARQIKVTLDNNANDGSNSGDNSSPAQYNDGSGDNVKATVEAVLGGAGNDSLIGNAAANWFDGGGGNDSIYGGDGTDTINGGTGADLAYGEGGDDYFFVQDSLGDRFLGGAGTTFAQYDTTLDGVAPSLTTSPSSTLTAMALSTFAPVSTFSVNQQLDELDPDETFGSAGNGNVITSINGTLAQINDVAIQQVQTSPGVFEEKIVAVGTAIGPRGNYDMLVVRYNADGTLDTTFGPSHTGLVYTDFSIGSGYNYDVANSLVIGAGGKIIVAGYTFKRSDLDNSTLKGFADYAVARYLPNGTLDNSFSGDGLATFDLGGPQSDDRASRIAIQNVKSGNTAEERYVVTGTLGLAFKNVSQQYPTADFGTIRITNSGSQDNAFGLIRTSFGAAAVSQDYATGLAIDPATNNIWVSGYTGSSAGNYDFAVAAYTSSGAAIAGAKTTLDLGGLDQAFDSVISGSQLLVVGDSVYNGFSDGAIAAFSIGGSSPAGTVLNYNYVFDSSNQPVDLRGVTIDNEGRGVAVGSLGAQDFYAYRFDTTDLTQIGDPVSVDFGSTDAASAVALQSDDKLVIAGLSGDDAALVRLEPKKWVDVQFSPEDVQAFDFTYTDQNNQTQQIPDYLVQRIKALLPDGTLVVDGTDASDTITVTQSNGIIEVNVNGDLFDVSASLVTKVVIHGLAGDDSITTDGSVSVPMNFDGGDGNDSLIGGPGNDSLTGGAGDDVLIGSAGADLFSGGAGFDTVDYSGRTENLTITLDGNANDGAAGENDNVGTDVEAVIAGSGDDSLIGNAADNLLNGGTGNDYIVGGIGNDSLFGGDGNDLLDGGDGDDLLNGGLGADVLTGGAGNDTADYSSRTENLNVTLDGVANDGAAGENDNVGTDVEIIVGGSGSDSLTGNSANNTLLGGGGNDLLDGGLGADFLSGGDGTDTVTYTSRTENLNISLDGVANDGASGEGDNVAADIEVVVGGSGNDIITAGAADPTLIGGAGDDSLVGGIGDDSLVGGVGNDSLYGSDGNDTLDGGDGDDLLDGGLGADLFMGGAGTDTASYASRTENLAITLDGNANDGAAGENDNVGTDVEVVVGGSGDDSITGDAANNTLIGGGGNDLLDGGLGADSLVGGSGIDTASYASRTENLTITLDGNANDGAAGEGDNVSSDIEVVIGGSGNDSITGNTSNNTLIGGAGNDLLDGGLGADLLVGGSGTDTASYASRTENLTITLDGVANDGASGEGDNVSTDIEVVITGSGNDTITGSASNETLIGGAGDDSITGGTGNDCLVGGVGNDSLYGLAGNDSLVGGDGDDLLDGGIGADLFMGGAGTDTASYASRTENLNITLDGNANDGASGEGDNVGTDIEVVIGGSGNDSITGGSGNDCLVGGAGNDSLYGAAGNDSLYGSAGNDLLVGGDGNDVLDGGLGTDSLVGGAGTDTASYASRTENLTITLDGVANDGASGEKDNVSTDIEVIIGGSGNDSITGNSASNTIVGGDGNDLLQGGDGVDCVVGGNGNDIILGGNGNDCLQGGDGRDIMIGGGDTDRLDGGAGDDILDGGTTNYDSNLTALYALMAEWVRTDIDYTTRVNHITGASGGGLNGTYLLNASTVHSSAAFPDSLTGGLDNDLFFAASSGDKVLDKATNEKVVTVHT